MTNSIEQTIISYFDNLLSDAESAELLRQVNQSPEHRRLFRQHETLRSLVQRAQANVVVDADTESSLFSRLATVKRQRSLRWLVTSKPMIGAALAVVAGLVSYNIYKQPVPNEHGYTNRIENTKRTEDAIQNAAQFSVSSSLAAGSSSAASSVVTANVPAAQSMLASKHFQDGATLNKTKLAKSGSTDASLTDVAHSNQASQPVAMNQSTSALPTAAAQSVIQPVAIAEQRIQPLRDISIASASLEAEPNIKPTFQFSVSGATETFDRNPSFNVGGRVAGGYFISSSDLIGLRVSMFRAHLAAVDITPQPKPAKDELEQQYLNQFATEAFVEHQMLVLNGRLMLTSSLSAGVITNGSTFSAELGASLPITSRLLAGLNVSIAHTHTSGDQPIEQTSAATSWQAEDARHALSTRIFYGISYRL